MNDSLRNDQDVANLFKFWNNNYFPTYSVPNNPEGNLFMQNLLINAKCGTNANLIFPYAILMKNSDYKYQIIKNKGATYPEQTANCKPAEQLRRYGGKSKRSKSKRSK